MGVTGSADDLIVRQAIDVIRSPRARYAAFLTPLLAGLALVSAGSAVTAAVGPRIGGCAVFPASNAWNRDVSRDPVDPRSDAYVNSISSGGARFLHADFGGNGAYGIPITVASKTQPRVPIRFDEYGDESDRGPYPVPPSARVEGGNASDGDRHVLVVQRSKCKLYELYHARRSGRGWVAGAGAVFDLRSNRQRPAGWTSADAAGLPIAPGLARYDEAKAGVIRHALRFTVQRSQNAYVAPARHLASSDSNANLPPMGLRLRMKASFSLSGYHGQARVILTALKRYGMIVADNGTSWYVTGAADRRWNDEDLNQLKGVPGSAFEVIRSGPLVRR
jgi:hypothetical protein